MEDSNEGLQNDPDFLRLKALRARLSTAYSLLVLGLFTLFVAVTALFRDAMAATVFGERPFTLAMLAAFLMVTLPILLATMFLGKSDRDIEPLRAELAEKQRAERAKAQKE